MSAPSRSGSSSPRRAVDRAESTGRRPSTALSPTLQLSPTTVPSWMVTFAPNWTPSPIETPSPSTRPGASAGGPHHGAAAPSIIVSPPRSSDVCIASSTSTTRTPSSTPGALGRSGGDRAQEVAALDAQRLGAGDVGDVDVAGVGADRAVRDHDRALVVHGHLAIGLHVVEDGHPLRADHGHLAHLVGVEPRQVQMADLAARELNVSKNHILDGGLDITLSARPDLDRIALEQVQDHRDVVHAEAPERVLVRPDRAQVDPVAVHVVHVAEVARIDQLAQLVHARVEAQQVADHQHPAAARDEVAQLVGLGGRPGHRLLDHDVLAGEDRPPGELEVGRHRRGEHDRAQLGVGQKLVVAGR